MKGIIFSGESVPGVLAGTKTQSRRTGGLEAVNEEPGRWRLWGPPHNGVWIFTDHSHQGEKGQIVRCKPRYQLGETVYMKEAFQLRQWVQDWETGHYDNFYDWQGPLPSARRDGWSIDYPTDFDDPGDYKWRSPLFMPQWASRAYIRIPGVRCERLHDISEADARAEGCESVAHFARRWDEVNGRRYPWTGNWWVWAYGFQLLT